MTDDLIKDLLALRNDVCAESTDALKAHAKRIAELEAEHAIHCAAMNRENMAAINRAEKAEADLAAARAALRLLDERGDLLDSIATEIDHLRRMDRNGWNGMMTSLRLERISDLEKAAAAIEAAKKETK